MAIEPKIENWDCDTVDNAKDDGGNLHNVAPGAVETTCRPASAGAWVDDVLEGADDEHIVAVNTGDGQYNGNFSPSVLHDSFKILWLKLNDLICYVKDIACQFTLATLADGEVVEGVLAKITGGANGCRTGIVDLNTLFDGQSLAGADEAFDVASDAGQVLLQDGGTSPPNNEQKVITIINGGNYLVTVKAQVFSAGSMTTVLMRVGINGDTAGSISLAGWSDSPRNGTQVISGSRVYAGLSPGDTVELYGEVVTGNASPVSFQLITLSTQLSPTAA